MSSLPVTYEMVRHSAEINTYIQQADASLIALGFTEHSFAHVTRCAAVASHLLEELGADERTVELDKERKTLTLRIQLDTAVCPVMDYFEIFLERMLLCRKAAEYFGLSFRLEVNGQTLL